MEPAIQPNYTHYTLTSFDPAAITVSGKMHFLDGYIDDQTIQFVQQGSNCFATACSVSESLSFWDYDANYCDVHNLVRNIGYEFTETIGGCRFKPKPGQENLYCNTQ